MINREVIETELPAGTPVLDFIRHHHRLTGTKEGCREGECGACAVLLGERSGNCMFYKTAASCMLPLGELAGKHLVTVEGVNGDSLTPVQQVLVKHGASQCGFCTPGIVLSLTGFFLTSPGLDLTDAEDALDGNICRCTGYASIRRAARELVDTHQTRLDINRDRLSQLVEWGILPGYFMTIPTQLAALEKDEPIPGPQEETPGRLLVAGATDLYIQKPDEMECGDLDFISRCAGSSCIRREDGHIVIGAGTPVEDMKNSPIIRELFPNMPGYLRRVSSTLMRNRATLAGNIMNASPIGDLTIILLALDATIVLGKKDKRRQLPLKKFFKGYKQLDREPGELLKEIHFPVPGPGWRFHFEKVSQRKHLDIASVNGAISIKQDGDNIGDVRISVGGVAPIPLFLEKTCEFLKGKTSGGDTINEAVRVMKGEISPISDVRGSDQYKRLLLGNLLKCLLNGEL